jgi:hypothetical protein
MTTRFNVGDKVVHSGLKATIFAVINTKEQFQSMGINYHFAYMGINYYLFEALKFDITTFEQYANDATQFPMNIIKYDEKSVLNIERINNWITANNLRNKLDTWFTETNGEYTPERKQALEPIWQLRRFIADHNINNDRIQIPSSELYDHIPITPYEEVKLEYALDNELALSGGRSRKRRRQYRSKKLRYRSRSRK